MSANVAVGKNTILSAQSKLLQLSAKHFNTYVPSRAANPGSTCNAAEDGRKPVQMQSADHKKKRGDFVNGNRLKGKIKERGKVQADVAAAIGLSASRFNAKINGKGGAEFTLGEVRAMSEYLCLTKDEQDYIFLD